MSSVPNDASPGASGSSLESTLDDILDRDEISPEERIVQLLRLGASRFGVTLGLLVQVDPTGDTYTIDEVSAAHSALTRGLTGDLLSTYCRMVVTEDEPLVVENALEQEGTESSAAYQSTLLSTYIGTTVEVDGEPYGTVCFVDVEPRAAAFDADDQALLGRLAEAVGTLVERRGNEPGRDEATQTVSAVERQYRTALQHSPLIFARVDEALRYEWIYNPYEDFDPRAVIGKRDDELDSGPGIDQLMELKRTALDRGEQRRDEIVFERADGLHVYDVTATPLREGGGTEVTGLVTASLDITDRKQQERELEESEARYRALAENFPDGGVGIYDRDLQYTLVEGTLVGEALPEADDFEGTRMPALFPDATVADLEPLFRAAVEDGVTDHVETEFNDRRWRVWATPLRDREGEIFAGLSFAQDITERTAAERRRKQVIRRVTDAIVEVDADWRFTLVNDQAEALYGMSEAELLGERFWDVFSEALGTRFEDTYRRVMQTREPASLEEYYPGLDGWFDIQVYPNDDGGLAFYFTEVTERKEREARLRDLSNSIPGVVFQVFNRPDAPSEDHFVSEHAADVLGIAPDPATFYERFLEHVPDSHRAALRASVEAAVENEEPWEFETPFDTPSGERRWILGRSTPRRQGEDVVFSGVLLDITDRKEDERRLDAVFNHTYQFTGLMEPDGTLIEANDTVLEFADLDEDEALGRPLWTIRWLQTGPVDTERLRDAVRRAADGEFVRYEMTVQGADGRRTIDFSLRPITNEQGEVTLIVTEGRDITDRKESEWALRQSRERLSMATEGGNIGTWNWNLSTDEVVFNQQWAEMLGYSRDELDFHFSTWMELVHPDDLSRAMDMLEAYIEGERDTYAPELRMRTKAGDWKWIQAVGQVVDRDEEGTVIRVAGIHLDIDERKRAERQLRQSERRFRQVFENAAIGIVIGDDEGRLRRANPAFEAMLGYDEGELKGKHFSDLTHPEDVSPDLDRFEELTEGVRDRYQIEKRYVRKGGEVFWARLTASLLDQAAETEHVALVEDIDDQKRYEEQLRRAKEEAEEAAHLKTVMLANMSHEIRTPLTSMIGFSGLLEGQLEGHPAKLARLIHKSGQRLEETMEAVLELSQLEAGSYAIDRAPVDVGFLARRIVDEFEPQSAAKDLTVQVEAPDSVSAYADETAVRRIISNLLDNAIKFTPEGGRVTIRVRPDTDEEVVLAVADTGVGIAEDALPRVFEAFKQESEGLTREYEGAGLGLSIVQKLVEALGGEVEVETEKDEGTCFFVRMPRATGEG